MLSSHVARNWPTVIFLVNLMAGLIAYCHQPNKPSLGRGLLLLPTA